MTQANPTIEPEPPTPGGVLPDGSGATPSAPKLVLTDFLDVSALQEIQDSFAAVTRLVTTIRDAQGQPITAPTNARRRDQSDAMLEHLISPDEDEWGRFVAPIVVEGQKLGSIVIEKSALGLRPSPARNRLRELALATGISSTQVDQVIQQAEESCGPNRAASLQFLYLLANSIARLCYDEYHSRQRVEELSALYSVSTVLSANRNLQQVLDTAARAVADVMKVKAVSIRLIKDDEQNQLVPRAVFNLSQTYLNKGTITLQQSDMFSEAMQGKVVYVEDMSADPRVLFPGDAREEGLVSMLCAGMIYQGRPIGTIQLFSGDLRRFTRYEVNLVRAIAQMLATAIENKRLDDERTENQRVVRQLHLAADVQRRMLPGKMPSIPPFEIAARYVPSFELGGDFYDFINLDGHLGIAVGDVVGKGVAASLLMASVRASLRAYAQDLYDLDEVIARVNVALTRDTLDNEFATLFYGVLDPATLRLTYCNAGHDPPMLVRRGKIHWLRTGGMLVGVDANQEYDKGLWDLQEGDMILLYTDGLPDAQNFEQKRFGRPRIEQALLSVADKSAADALNHVLWEMRRFTGLRRSVDDTTLVVVKVGPR